MGVIVFLSSMFLFTGSHGGIEKWWNKKIWGEMIQNNEIAKWDNLENLLIPLFFLQ